MIDIPRVSWDCYRQRWENFHRWRRQSPNSWSFGKEKSKKRQKMGVYWVILSILWVIPSPDQGNFAHGHRIGGSIPPPATIGFPAQVRKKLRNRFYFRFRPAGEIKQSPSKF